MHRTCSHSAVTHFLEPLDGEIHFFTLFCKEETKKKSNFIESDTKPDNLLSNVMFFSKNAFSYSKMYILSSVMLALSSKMCFCFFKYYACDIIGQTQLHLVSCVKLIEFKVKDSERFQQANPQIHVFEPPFELCRPGWFSNKSYIVIDLTS